MDTSNVLVLASGGIDSTACIAFYLSQGASVQGAFFNYGQKAARNERAAVRAVGNHFNIPIREFDCSLREFDAGLIPGRNLFLLTAALLSLVNTSGIIALGIHAGTDYVDCSPIFVREAQNVFDLSTDGKVQIAAPFLSWNKIKIWDYCIKQNVPLQLTYSCENGGVRPCGACLSCKDLERLYAMAR
jgi:7-cyano-7-deazaguanine synthase